MDDGGDSMDFTPRMQQILQRLLSEIDFVSEQTLADNLGISKRTVQRELDGTTGALASYGLQLQRKKKPDSCSSGLRKKRTTGSIPANGIGYGF